MRLELLAVLITQRVLGTSNALEKQRALVSDEPVLQPY